MVEKKLNKDNRITILMLSWRDIKNPMVGGAEVFTHEILKGLDCDKYRLIHFSPSFEGCEYDESIDGIKYLRKGNLFSVILFARKFYKINQSNIDIVIDQCNTHRFFTKFWVEKEKRCFFIFQLTRELWTIVLKTKLAWLGRWLETPMLRLNRKDHTFTESASVKKELIDVGFQNSRVHVIPIGLSFSSFEIKDFEQKEDGPVFIYVGRYSRYKGLNDLIIAFGNIKKAYSTAKLWIVGKEDSTYFQKELVPILEQYSLSFGKSTNDDVTVWGFVDENEKLNLMSRAKILLFPSQREGWGMIVTEAGAVGTPSIVYNSTGCIDAVDMGHAGYLCDQNTPAELERLMLESIENTERYNNMRIKAYEFSKCFEWKNSANELDYCIQKIINEKMEKVVEYKGLDGNAEIEHWDLN